jgi:hypothetical protein
MSRLMRSTIWHAQPRRFITNVIRCRRRKPACMAQSICLAWQSALRPKSCKPPRPKFMATRMCIPRQKTIGGMSIRLGPGPVTMKESDALKPCFSTIGASIIGHQSGENLRHLWSTHAPKRRTRCIQFHRPGAALPRHYNLWRRSADAIVLLLDDLIDGLIQLMATGESVTGPINIGNPSEFSILQLADMVVDMTGSRSRIVHRPLPQNDPRQRRPDISRAQELLSWQPRMPLKEGSIRTIAYFEKLLSDNVVRNRLERSL